MSIQKQNTQVRKLRQGLQWQPFFASDLAR